MTETMQPKSTSINSAEETARRVAALSPRQRALLLGKLRKDAVDGHTLVAGSLKALGVERVYTLVGTPMGGTLAACARRGVRVLGVRHQQAAVLMATADNYVSGRLSAVPILSPGPGVTNGATGILVAQNNCWPLVVLGGRRPLNMQGLGSFQELAGVPIFESITKRSSVVEATAGIPEELHAAFRTARRDRPGVVYLDLPEDVLSGVAGVPGALPDDDDHRPPPVDRDAAARAAGILLAAARPALIVGKGTRWSEPYEELRLLVERHGIPFITSPMGRGCLPDEHPLCFNDASRLLQSRADAILVAGARLNWTFRFGSELSPDAKVIHLDIHAGEIGRNVEPAVGLVGEVKDGLRAILEGMDRGDGGGRLSAWHAELDGERWKTRRELEPLVNSEAIPMAPQRMMKEIREVLPEDAICVLDGNVSMAAAQQVIPARAPVSLLTPGTDGCMGVGIPFALGAKLAAPRRVVVTICGDAALGFNAMEMETANRYNVPVVVVVANNDGISGALTQTTFFPPEHEPVATFQRGIRYQEVMKTFGGHAECVEDPQQLKPALERAMASGRPACINVRVDPSARYPGG